jgi:AcrR family transcriptional regulator
VAEGSGRAPYRKADEVKAAVLEAATELFATHTPDAVSLRQIAERAGVQHSLIIRHFGTKDEVVRQVLIRMTEGYAASVDTTSSAPDGFKAAFDYMLGEPAAIRSMVSAVIGAEGLVTEGRPFPGVARHLAQMEADGATGRDPRIVAVVAVTLMGGWAMLEPWARAAGGLQDVEVDDLRQQVTEILEAMVRRESGLET